MNKVILIGNLTKKPEIRVTQTGKKVANFSLALNEGRDKPATYINCIAWEKTAELLELYANVGDKLALEGKIQNRTWDKSDGTKGYATDIVVSTVEFLTPKSERTYVNTSEVVEPPTEINVEDLDVSMPF